MNYPIAEYAPLTADTTRGPTASLWARINWQLAALDPNRGFHMFQELMDFPTFVTSGAQLGSWDQIFDSNCTIALDPTTIGGVVKMTTDATDNQEVYLEWGAGKGSFMKVQASTGPFCFETRVKISSIANAAMDIIMGLTEEGVAAADFIADGGAMTTVKDLIGWNIKIDDGDSIDAVYAKASGSLVADTEGAYVPVADTWMKLGLYYDGVSTMYWYVDGVEVASALITATHFPAAEELVPFYGFKNGGAAAMSMSIDWFKAAMLLNTSA